MQTQALSAAVRAVTANMSNKSTGEAEDSDPKPKGGEESEEESDVLEESPCGRWQKRREEVYTSPTLSAYIAVHCILILTLKNIVAGICLLFC